MNALHRLSLAVPALALVVLAACGGGGSSSTPATTALPSSVPTAISTGTGQATFRIDTGGSATSAVARSAQYVSPATQSATILLGTKTIATLNLTTSTAGCTTTSTGSTSCVFTLVVPSGQQTFTIDTWSRTDGTGNLLSAATVTFTIVQNATNTISLALNGVVASASVVLDATSFVAGTAASTTVHVNAYDASGNIIVGAGNFTNPLTLTDSDTTGATQLVVSQLTTGQALRRTTASQPATTLTAPSQTVTLSYNGSSFSGASVSVSGSGITTVVSPSFTATGNASTEYQLSQVSETDAIAAGNDGKMWFSSYGLIGNISTTGTGQTTFTSGLPSDYFDALAPDASGNMWYGGNYGNLGSVGPTGNATPIVSMALPQGCDGGEDSRNAGARVRRTGQGTTRISLGASPSPSSSPSSGPNLTSCGPINWMAVGPDGYVWFADDDGEIGRIMPDHTAEEWPIEGLANYGEGSYYPEPEQFAFGSDGNIYVNDEWNGNVIQISISGGVPQSAIPVYSGNCGGYALAIGPDGYIYAGDDATYSGCGSFVAILTPGANFTSNNQQFFDMTSIDNNNNGEQFLMFASSPGGIWAVDSSQTLYRISNVGTAPAGTLPPLQPIVTTLTPFTQNDGPYIVALGPDGNIWSHENSDPDYLVKVMYGAPTVGSTQSVKRLTPMSVRPHGSNAGRRRNGSVHGRLTMNRQFMAQKAR